MSGRFKKLVTVMDRLRGPRGCPWDKEQTPQSLKPFLLEEAYEVLEAIDGRDRELLKEELGDLLFQVVFHAQIAGERRQFTIEDVLQAVTDKMIRRHPHVFGKAKARTAREALTRWETLKHQEERNRKRRSVLEGVPKTLPALMRAYQLQTRAARVGFDWKTIGPVWAKVREETQELEDSVRQGSSPAVLSEFGDLLFALVNLARFLKIDPEEALRTANRRFSGRFQKMERAAKASGLSLAEMSLAGMDRLWEKAKRAEKKSIRRRAR